MHRSQKPTARSRPAPADALLQQFTAAHSPSTSTPSIIKLSATTSCRSPHGSVRPTRSHFVDVVASHRSRFVT
ncbi:hypothetical protein WN943_010604 [Citrus x changshan-huyou]